MESNRKSRLILLLVIAMGIVTVVGAVLMLPPLAALCFVFLQLSAWEIYFPATRRARVQGLTELNLPDPDGGR